MPSILLCLLVEKANKKVADKGERNAKSGNCYC